MSSSFLRSLYCLGYLKCASTEIIPIKWLKLCNSFGQCLFSSILSNAFILPDFTRYLQKERKFSVFGSYEYTARETSLFRGIYIQKAADL